MGVAKTDTSQRIAKDAARQVTFSKRRAGLFKKAFELSVLCGVELAVVVFSQTGKVFSFAHPEIDYVISEYRGSQDDDTQPYDDEKLREIHARVEELLPRYNRAVEQSKIVKEHYQRLRQLRRRLEVRWWNIRMCKACRRSSSCSSVRSSKGSSTFSIPTSTIRRINSKKYSEEICLISCLHIILINCHHSCQPRLVRSCR